jgi:hydrogenase nickel incorporation protein HypA/HybF
MHELSIAAHLSELALQYLPKELAGSCVTLRVHIGALTCVSADSLQFCFGSLVEGTPLEGAKLAIDTLPVIVYCDHCGQLRELPTIQALVCPECGRPSADIRQGQELNLHSLEIEDDLAVSSG